MPRTQELLGGIAALDPTAGYNLRVVACFDELIIGNVNRRGLLAAAASLAGCNAGFLQERPQRIVRVTARRTWNPQKQVAFRRGLDGGDRPLVSPPGPARLR